MTDGGGVMVYTETAGAYTIKIEALATSVATTPCFQKAVASVDVGCKETVTIRTAESYERLNTTPTEMLNSNQITIEANGVASFTTANSINLSPIVGFDSGDDNLVIESIKWNGSEDSGSSTYTVKLRNVSNSAVTLPGSACKIWFAEVGNDLTAKTYTVCGSLAGGGDN